MLLLQNFDGFFYGSVLRPQQTRYIAKRDFRGRLGADFPKRAFAGGRGVAVRIDQKALPGWHELLGSVLLMARNLNRLWFAGESISSSLSEGGGGTEKQQGE